VAVVIGADGGAAADYDDTRMIGCRCS